MGPLPLQACIGAVRLTGTSAISYLDNGVVFVGSAHGDSALIRLATVRDEAGSFIQVKLRVDVFAVSMLSPGAGHLSKPGPCCRYVCHGHGQVMRAMHVEGGGLTIKHSPFADKARDR